MNRKRSFFLSVMLRAAAILPAALFPGACGGFQGDPRDDSYEIRTPAQYRGLVTVVPANTTATVTGEGTEGIFVAGRTLILGAYSIAKYETTWELWKEVYDWARENGYSIANEGTGGETRPVTGVTWRDALVWCNAYSELSGLEPVYYTADGTMVLRTSENNGALDRSTGTDADLAVAKREKNGFRLPLETEWEHAARGGDPPSSDWNLPYAGSDNVDDVAWSGDNAALEGSPGYGARPVGSKTGGAREGANRLGLFDMSGNAAEWCQDWHDASIVQNTPPDGPESGSERIIRGGSWSSDAAACGVKSRDSREPFVSGTAIGFRVARTIPAPAADNESGYLPTLVDTSWYWDSPWGMRIIYFQEDGYAFFDNYGNPFDDYYTYDPSRGTGRIIGGYPAGDFQLKNDNKVMFFPNYKDYGHSAEFYFMEEE